MKFDRRGVLVRLDLLDVLGLLDVHRDLDVLGALLLLPLLVLGRAADPALHAHAVADAPARALRERRQLARRLAIPPPLLRDVPALRKGVCAAGGGGGGGVDGTPAPQALLLQYLARIEAARGGLQSMFRRDISRTRRVGCEKVPRRPGRPAVGLSACYSKVLSIA